MSMRVCVLSVAYIPFNPVANEREKKLRAESSRQINTKRNYSFCVSNNSHICIPIIRDISEGLTVHTASRKPRTIKNIGCSFSTLFTLTTMNATKKSIVHAERNGTVSSDSNRLYNAIHCNLSQIRTIPAQNVAK